MGFQRKALWVSLAAAWVLAGCGGGRGGLLWRVHHFCSHFIHDFTLCF